MDADAKFGRSHHNDSTRSMELRTAIPFLDNSPSVTPSRLPRIIVGLYPGAQEPGISEGDDGENTGYGGIYPPREYFLKMLT